MSGYVGMDVHRKRSQVAVLDDAGVPQRNRNVPNDPAQLVPILGALAPGTPPVAFEAAYGWGWLVELLKELELEPHLVHPSRCKADRLGQAQERQGRCLPWRSCCAPTCCPRHGSRRSRSATCGRCCVTAPAWCACRPGPRTASTRCWPTGGSSSRPGCGPAPAGPGWLSFTAADPAGDHRGLPGLAGRSRRTDRPPGTPDPHAGQARPRVQALMALPGVAG
jgi:hypothetical protein